MILMAEWEVYIIQTKSGKFYTGITNDLERRFNAHKTRQGGARFFRFSSPEKIVYRESHPNRQEASRRECAIKKMSRKEKMALTRQSHINQDFFLMVKAPGV